jgi:hypothetical protein
MELGDMARTLRWRLGLLVLTLACFASDADLVRMAWASGGATAGASHKNCATTEPTINSASTTVLCDDFEKNGFGGTPGVWYARGCDQAGTGGSGEAATETKGWCGQPADVPGDIGPFTICSGGGANGTACTARSSPNANAEAHASHNFETSCVSGGLNCTLVFGMAHYDEIYYRFMIRFDVGWTGGIAGNQKLITINPAGGGTGGIVIAGAHGMPGNDGRLLMCPVLDCNYLSDTYKNGQANGEGGLCGGGSFLPTECVYLGQNAGNGVVNVVGARLGHWTAVEIYIKLNTSDVQNGLYKMWVDECGTSGTTCPATQTLRANYTNIRYRGAAASNSTQKIGNFFIDTWTGGINPDEGSIGTVRIDQVVVSTQQIGWMGAAASPRGLILRVVFIPLFIALGLAVWRSTAVA